MLRYLARKAFHIFVRLRARLQRMWFPDTFVSRQKWEMLSGRYEPDSVAVFRRLIHPGMTVVDLGAHIGYFTRLFSKLVGRNGKVLAVEADPSLFMLLQKNVSRLPNVAAQHIAASERRGTIDFYHSEEKSGCGSIVRHLPVAFKKTKLTVPTADLDFVLERRGVRRVDFIKMDIEGGEPRALRGMQRTLAQNAGIILVTEFAPEWLRAGGTEPLRFLRELEALGFNISAIINGSLVPFNPATEDEMRAAMPVYFVNLCCRRA